MLLVSRFYFFFFQAEDGIRDSSVTGVQTCALPISARHLLSKKKAIEKAIAELEVTRRDGETLAQLLRRSEERREGKSVDLGGRRIIKKKKRRRGAGGGLSKKETETTRRVSRMSAKQ